MRAVQGVIFFGYNDLDPQTTPWTQIVRAYVLPDVLHALEQQQPQHPLVAVFKPLLAESEEELQREAGGYYRAIKASALPAASKTTLLEVFVSWLEQRLKDKGKKEIEAMLLGELPNLEETQSGKDLIRIGEQRAAIETRQQTVIRLLRKRFGDVPAEVVSTVESTTDVDQLDQWLDRFATATNLEELKIAK